MNHASKLCAALCCLSALAVGCGDKAAPEGASSASPAKSSAAAAGSAKVAASASAAATAAPAAAEAGSKEVTGKALLEQLKLPADSSEHKVPDMEGFAFRGPKDAKLSLGSPMDRKKKWGTVSAGGKSAAMLLANHEQDEGEKCMKLADAKAKLAGAKIVRELTLTSAPEESGGKNTDHGETIELVVFERDGKQGFYAHKEFNHGDDSTHVCCAAGAPADAKELKGTADPADVDALSAVCLSMTFSF